MSVIGFRQEKPVGMRTKHQLIMDSRVDVVARSLLERDNRPSYIPEETRRYFLLLSGPKCRVCGRMNGDFHIDHILPVSRGGTCCYENLQVLCRSCNLQKSFHGLDPRSYEVGYVIPIQIVTDLAINNRLLDILADPSM